MPSRNLLIATLLGLVLYLVAFTFVVDRPLTVGEIGGYINYKSSFLASLTGRRKIAIFAGSNGRYSHRCETIAKLSGIPCANLSSAAGFDLSWQMAHYLPKLGRDDVLYMPLEYWPLLPAGAKVGSEAPYVVRHEHAALSMYTPNQLAHAFFYFDLRYFISAVGEMLLQRAGVQRRTSTETMTVQGDERDATADKAAAYLEFTRTTAAPTVSVSDYRERDQRAALEKVIEAAQARGVIVVGGLPTTFADTVVPQGAVELLQRIFEQRGACFLILPNHSLYPRQEFFDTEYHLRESAQIAHSELLAQPLAAIWHDRSCKSLRVQR